ncbi:MAG TPA: efflux RND transporter periplasmic adaptor subunit [Terriglobales bacterium]|nr:efflux RND transporter periplasmic adaptor subunit [Terriglobales bacterium]
MNSVLQTRMRSRGVQIGIVVLIIIVGLITLAFTRKSAPQYFTAKVTKGDIVSTVQATGTVNALKTVQVGSQISGRIVKLFVDFNSRVKQGQLIAQIDPTVYENQVAQAKADLQNAEASVRSGEAMVGVQQAAVATAKANVEKAEAALHDATLVQERTMSLFQQGIDSQQQRDDAVAAYNTDLADLHAQQAAEAQAEANLRSAMAQVAAAKAQVAIKQGALRVAETNLSYCNIYSPIDGVVVNRAVDVGQTVAASFQTPTLFTIAQDLTKMQVDTQTDESDVGRLKVGDPATFTVDAFPNEIFHGRVAQIRMNATTVQNVVEYDTVIDFDNPGERVFPGMTAYVNIPSAIVHDQLEVPNAALRFKPDLKPDQMRELLAKYGMGGGAANGNGGTATARAGANGGAAAGGGTPGGGPRYGSAQRMGGGQGFGGGQRPGGNRAGGGAGPSDVTFHASTALIWKLGPNKELIPVRIRTGITDFTNTAVMRVLKGSLEPGDLVVTGQVVQRSMGGPPMGGGFRR